MDDLRSPRSHAELIATGTALYTALADHVLLGQGPVVRKRKIHSASACTGGVGICQSLDEAFELLFARGRTDTVIGLCLEVLASSGGWLFDGYKAVAPSHWRLQRDEEAIP